MKTPQNTTTHHHTRTLRPNADQDELLLSLHTMFNIHEHPQYRTTYHAWFTRPEPDIELHIPEYFTHPILHITINPSLYEHWTSTKTFNLGATTELYPKKRRRWLPSRTFRSETIIPIHLEPAKPLPPVQTSTDPTPHGEHHMLMTWAQKIKEQLEYEQR